MAHFLDKAMNLHIGEAEKYPKKISTNICVIGSIIVELLKTKEKEKTMTVREK